MVSTTKGRLPASMLGTLQKACASTPPSEGAAEPEVAVPDDVPLLVPLADPLCEPEAVPDAEPDAVPDAVPELEPLVDDPEVAPPPLLLAQPANRPRQIVETGASRGTKRTMMTSVKKV